MQSSRKRDSSSDWPLKQDSRKREDAMRQTRRMRGNGATRNSIAGADEETRKRGDPGNREADATEDQRPGATRSLITGSAEGCGIRGNSKLHSRRSQRSEDSGRPGNSPLASPEGAGSGETRTATSRRAEENEASGQPGDSTSAKPEDAGSGATRKLIERRHWRAKIRGNPEIRRQGRRMMRDSVATGDPSPAEAGRRVIGATREPVGKQYWYSEYAGRPGFLKPVLLKDARVEATRNSIAGTACRCRKRGDPRPHQRRSMRSEGAGTLVDSPQAALQGATLRRLGETAPGLNGRCMVR